MHIPVKASLNLGSFTSREQDVVAVLEKRGAWEIEIVLTPAQQQAVVDQAQALYVSELQRLESQDGPG